ncbi:MAG: SPOR domain-containing protein [bacterium]|nr:SPOR domain-containing protein [bacterium]
MAAKDVNLLDDDQDDYDDAGGGGASALLGEKKSRGGGGSKKLIRNLVIALVALAVLGGGGWGVYQWWWVPRLKKEQERIEAQRRLEELKKKREILVREEEERRKKEEILLKKLQESKAQKPESESPPAQPAAPRVAAKKSAPAPAAKPSAPKSQRRVAQKVTPPPAPRPAAPAPRRATASVRGTFFSVQVATCRTSRCVDVFANRLRQKGFEPIVSPGAVGGGRNEVVIGKLPTRDEAEALVELASRKNIRARSYRSGNSWNVSAGGFADLERAAQRLDQVEEAGFRGEIIGSGGSAAGRFRTVRSGRLRTRQEALTLRARIVNAGFAGSFVVRQNGAN